MKKQMLFDPTKVFTPEQEAQIFSAIRTAETWVNKRAPMLGDCVVLTRYIKDYSLPAPMATRPEANGTITIWWNPILIVTFKMTLKDIAKALIHEWWHTMNGHCFSPLAEHELDNIAADAELDQPPYVFVEDGDFFDTYGVTFTKLKLPEGLTREAYYAELQKKACKRPKDPGNQPGNQPKNPGDQPGNGNGQGQPDQKNRFNDGSGQGQGQKDPKDGQGNGQPDAQGQGPDQQGNGQGQDSDDEFKNLQPANSGYHGRWDPSNSAAEAVWRELVSEIVEQAFQQGTMPADVAEKIKLKWRRLPKLEDALKQIVGSYISKSMTKSPTRKKMSRRFPLMPGRKKKYGPRLVFAIDTSGSMPTDAVRLAAEIANSVAEKYEVTLIQCDADVAEVVERYKPTGDEFGAKGRGGTDFRPVFDYIKDELDDDIDALIYVTDTGGDFPKHEPSYLVHWIVTVKEGAHQNIPFGETLFIGKDISL